MTQENAPPQDPGREALYRASLASFHSPPASSGSGLLLVISLSLFVVVQSDSTLQGLAVLVGVLLFHELGHWAGMRLFGYRDVRMFFIPFFGAAVSGQPRGVAAWKDAVVSLLGPLPGIAAGIGALVGLGFFPTAALEEVATTLLFLNGFNLLPLGGLDGGRFFQRVLLSRHRVLEAAFIAGSGLLLAALAAAMGSIALGIFAGLGLVTLPVRWRLLSEAARLREAGVAPADGVEPDERESRALFEAALRTTAAVPQGYDVTLGRRMNDLRDVLQRPPRFLASAALIGVAAGALVAALLAGLVVATVNAESPWERHQLGGFSVELPGQPATVTEVRDTPAGRRPVETTRAGIGFLERFQVQRVDAGGAVDAGAWTAWSRARLEEQTGAQVIREEPLPDGAELELSRGWRVYRARVMVSGAEVLVATAGAPERGEPMQRFLGSLQAP